jgi:hypothetical protein
VVAGALPFFLIGHACRGIRSPWFGRMSWLAWIAVMLGIALFQLPLQFHMRMAEYGWPILSTFGGVGAFLGLLRLMEWVDRPWLSRLFVPIAGASMTIMYLHTAFLGWAIRNGIDAMWLILLIGVAGPLAIHLALARIPVLSPLFLGQVSRARVGRTR